MSQKHCPGHVSRVHIVYLLNNISGGESYGPPAGGGVMTVTVTNTQTRKVTQRWVWVLKASCYTIHSGAM